MIIILKLKLFFSVLLLCCLFLPLSQCTKSEKQNDGVQSEKVIENQYVFESAKDIESWLGALAFVAPLAMFFVAKKTPYRVAAPVAYLLCGGAALYVIFSVTFFSERILIGGYLAYICSISLILLALIELCWSFRLYIKAKKGISN